MKRARGKSVHRKIDILAKLNDTNVRFGHIRVDLHFGEIIRDGENDRRLQTGGDRLANIDIARNHQPIDRRRDRAVVEVRLCLVECPLFDLRVGFGLMQRCGGLIDIRLR